jgi:hypothetical protein
VSLAGAPPSAIWALVFIALVGVAAWRVRIVLAPRWAGAQARLAEAVVGISLAIVLAELLGLLGLLSGLGLELGAAVVAGVAVALTWDLRSEGGAGEGAGWLALAAAAALVAISAFIWLLGALRVLDGGSMVFDSNWYHLPLAASFARSGSVTGVPPIDPITLARFYPANSELLHAMGMAVLHRDVLSPLVNVGWMALALLAGWCIGRPFGAAPLSMLGVAVVLDAHVLTASQAGSATNDAAATAALLAAAALTVAAFAGADRSGEHGALGPVAVAGLAAGLAAGTKLNLLVPVAVLGVGTAILAAWGSRLRTSVVWLAGAAATGGLWYLRNLFVTGNPLPWLHSIGPLDLPGPAQPSGLRPAYTVVHYLGDGSVWSDHFIPGLRVELGDLWPLLVALALAAIIWSIVRPAVAAVRVLGLAALAGVVAYVLTPLSAAGPEGDPVAFPTNLRWLAPFLALALALAPLAVVRWRVAAAALAVAFLAIGVVNLDVSAWADDPNLAAALIVAAAGTLVWAGVIALRRSHLSPYLAPLAAGALAVAVATAVAVRTDDYLSDRFTAAPARTGLQSAFQWARGIRGARIAIGGTAVAVDQYPLDGVDVSNDVGYLGRDGPSGSLDAITSCRAWRLAIDARPIDYVVTGPNFNADDPAHPSPAPEGTWTTVGSGASPVAASGPTTVFRISGPLAPGACGR